eukprot:SAG11_NODE_412_length_9695_cov_5.948729_5_plen_1572_part_00
MQICCTPDLTDSTDEPTLDAFLSNVVTLQRCVEKCLETRMEGRSAETDTRLQKFLALRLEVVCGSQTDASARQHSDSWCDQTYRVLCKHELQLGEVMLTFKHNIPKAVVEKNSDRISTLMVCAKTWAANSPSMSVSVTIGEDVIRDETLMYYGDMSGDAGDDDVPLYSIDFEAAGQLGEHLTNLTIYNACIGPKQLTLLASDIHGRQTQDLNFSAQRCLLNFTTSNKSVKAAVSALEKMKLAELDLTSTEGITKSALAGILIEVQPPRLILCRCGLDDSFFDRLPQTKLSNRNVLQKSQRFMDLRENPQLTLAGVEHTQRLMPDVRVHYIKENLHDHISWLTLVADLATVCQKTSEAAAVAAAKVEEEAAAKLKVQEADAAAAVAKVKEAEEKEIAGTREAEEAEAAKSAAALRQTKEADQATAVAAEAARLTAEQEAAAEAVKLKAAETAADAAAAKLIDVEEKETAARLAGGQEAIEAAEEARVQAQHEADAKAVLLNVEREAAAVAAAKLKVEEAAAALAVAKLKETQEKEAAAAREAEEAKATKAAALREADDEAAEDPQELEPDSGKDSDVQQRLVEEVDVMRRRVQDIDENTEPSQTPDSFVPSSFAGLTLSELTLSELRERARATYKHSEETIINSSRWELEDLILEGEREHEAAVHTLSKSEFRRRLRNCAMRPVSSHLGDEHLREMSYELLFKPSPDYQPSPDEKEEKLVHLLQVVLKLQAMFRHKFTWKQMLAHHIPKIRETLDAVFNKLKTIQVRKLVVDRSGNEFSESGVLTTIRLNDDVDLVFEYGEDEDQYEDVTIGRLFYDCFCRKISDADNANSNIFFDERRSQFISKLEKYQSAGLIGDDFEIHLRGCAWKTEDMQLGTKIEKPIKLLCFSYDENEESLVEFSVEAEDAAAASFFRVESNRSHVSSSTRFLSKGRELKHAFACVKSIICPQAGVLLNVDWQNLQELDVSRNKLLSAEALRVACTTQYWPLLHTVRCIEGNWTSHHLEAIVSLPLKRLEITSTRNIKDGMLKFLDSVAARQRLENDLYVNLFALKLRPADHNLRDSLPITEEFIRAVSQCWLEELDLADGQHEYEDQGTMLFAQALQSKEWRGMKSLMPWVDAHKSPKGMLELFYAALTHRAMDHFAIYLGPDQKAIFKQDLCVCRNFSTTDLDWERSGLIFECTHSLDKDGHDSDVNDHAKNECCLYTFGPDERDALKRLQQQKASAQEFRAPEPAEFKAALLSEQAESQSVSTRKVTRRWYEKFTAKKKAMKKAHDKKVMKDMTELARLEVLERLVIQCGILKSDWFEHSNSQFHEEPVNYGLFHDGFSIWSDPLAFSLGFAQRCQLWADTSGSQFVAWNVAYAPLFLEYSEKFELYATSLLEECKNACEAEKVLLSTQSYGAGRFIGGHEIPHCSAAENHGERVTPLDYALQADLAHFVSNLWVDGYIVECWYSVDPTEYGTSHTNYDTVEHFVRWWFPQTRKRGHKSGCLHWVRSHVPDIVLEVAFIPVLLALTLFAVPTSALVPVPTQRTTCILTWLYTTSRVIIATWDTAVVSWETAVNSPIALYCTLL